MSLHQHTKISTPEFSYQERARSANQDIGLFFSSLSPLLLFAMILLGCIIVMSLGAWIAYFRFKSGIREPESPIGTAVAATFGLLAFILGFTFSVTWNRFVTRNSLVIQQAGAIELCYLRAGLIPQKQKIEIRKLLREYAKILLDLKNAPSGLNTVLVNIERLHTELWYQTETLVHEEVDSELRSLFTSSVNELIGLVIERKTIALLFRIPDPIWASLLFLAGMGMFAFGYQTGMNGIRRIFQMPFLPIAFSIIIVLIADLNSSGKQRSFKVTHKPLEDVLDKMNRDLSLAQNNI